MKAKILNPFRGWPLSRALCSLLLCAAGTLLVKADDMAYATFANGDFGTIDLNTGVVSVRGNSGQALQGLGVENGILYGAGALSGGELFSINPANGSLTHIGFSGIQYINFGSTPTGGLFAVDFAPGTGHQDLYSINATTGAATLIGPTNVGSGGTSSLSNNSSTLFYFQVDGSGNNFWSLNKSSGAGTPIGNTGGPLIGAMVLVNGTLYGGDHSGGIDTINTTTGVVTAGPVNSDHQDILGLTPLVPAPRGSRYDFNGDGRPDYVLYSASTRQTAIWYLNNNIYQSGALGPTLPAGWGLIDVADFNGDGHPDYVLANASTRQTAIWYLNNNVFISGAGGPTPPASWSLVAAADFNGDGHPDYILVNASTRQTAIWYLNNNVLISGADGPTLPAGWSLVAAADFNGDGHPDYVLVNDNTRQTAIWYLNNNTLVSGVYGPTLPAGWSLAKP